MFTSDWIVMLRSPDNHVFITNLKEIVLILFFASLLPAKFNCLSVRLVQLSHDEVAKVAILRDASESGGA